MAPVYVKVSEKNALYEQQQKKGIRINADGDIQYCTTCSSGWRNKDTQS